MPFEPLRSHWSAERALRIFAGSDRRCAFRVGRFCIDLHHPKLSLLHECRLERALGVVYRPDLPAQFDAMLHFDRTGAVEPLDPDSAVEIYSEAQGETLPRQSRCVTAAKQISSSGAVLANAS
jgi:hypothetical protein